MRNAINVYITPDGRCIRVPEEVWRATKWTKGGQLDRRYEGNALAAAWIAEQEAATNLEDGVDALGIV
jgi:hypothetical protein